MPVLIFTIIFLLYQIIVNDDLQGTTKKLISYITGESWQYCDRCNIVEPNKMLPALIV